MWVQSILKRDNKPVHSVIYSFCSEVLNFWYVLDICTDSILCVLCHVCCGLGSADFVQIIQVYLTGARTIIWLPECQWSDHGGFFLLFVLLITWARKYFHMAQCSSTSFYRLQMTFSDAFLENFCILFPISLKFVPTGPIDSKSALVQIVTWFQKYDNSLPEPTLTQFINAYLLLVNIYSFNLQLCTFGHFPYQSCYLWKQADYMSICCNLCCLQMAFTVLMCYV